MVGGGPTGRRSGFTGPGGGTSWCRSRRATSPRRPETTSAGRSSGGRASRRARGLRRERPARATCATSSSARARTPGSCLRCSSRRRGRCRGGRAGGAHAGGRRRRRARRESGRRRGDRRARVGPALRRRPLRGARRRAAACRHGRSVHADQHRHERAAVRARDRVRRALGGGRRLGSLLRCRRDRPARRPERRARVRDRDRRGVGRPGPRERRAKRHLEHRVHRGRRRQEHRAAARARAPARRGLRRPAPGGPHAEGAEAAARAGAGADRLRVVQSDHAGPERAHPRGRRLHGGARPPGRHVPAHAAHRVRRPPPPCNNGVRPQCCSDQAHHSRATASSTSAQRSTDETSTHSSTA